MTDRIPITGATGTNGTFLVERLAAQGTEPQVMTRSRQSPEQFAARGIKTFIGDFDAPETLPPALEGVDKVFLLSEADPRQVEMQGNMIEEVFNMFNHANFGIPLRVLFDTQGNRIASAGQIKNTVTPSRQIQFGLKFTF